MSHSNHKGVKMHQNQVQRGGTHARCLNQCLHRLDCAPPRRLHHLTRTFGVGWEALGMGPPYLSHETIRYRICNSPSTTKE